MVILLFLVRMIPWAREKLQAGACAQCAHAGPFGQGGGLTVGRACRPGDTLIILFFSIIKVMTADRDAKQVMTHVMTASCHEYRKVISRYQIINSNCLLIKVSDE